MSGDSARSFDPRLIGAVIVAGIVAFIAFAALSAFAPDLRSGRDGGAHALSRSAVSYSALARILTDAGITPTILRADAVPPGQGLVILTPPAGGAGDALADRLDAIGDRPVLIVLPKWRTGLSPERGGWVQRSGLITGNRQLRIDDNNILTLNFRQTQRSVAPTTGVVRGTYLTLTPSAQPVAISGGDITSLNSNGDGMMIASVNARPNVMILADADLLNNHGIATDAHAQQAVRLMLALGVRQGVAFDVSLNGYGSGRSLLRLAFTPPFLSLTLCLLFAGLLALWSGFIRFGPPWRDVRAVALGKAALIANGAALIVQARRVPHFAERYALSVRDAAARRLHAPAGLDGDALTAWLDRFVDTRGQKYTELSGALMTARTGPETVARAAALGQWRKDVVRD